MRAEGVVLNREITSHSTNWGRVDGGGAAGGALGDHREGRVPTPILPHPRQELAPPAALPVSLSNLKGTPRVDQGLQINSSQ